jgi:hypothetical protein
MIPKKFGDTLIVTDAAAVRLPLGGVHAEGRRH